MSHLLRLHFFGSDLSQINLKYIHATAPRNGLNSNEYLLALPSLFGTDWEGRRERDDLFAAFRGDSWRHAERRDPFEVLRRCAIRSPRRWTITIWDAGKRLADIQQLQSLLTETFLPGKPRSLGLVAHELHSFVMNRLGSPGTHNRPFDRGSAGNNDSEVWGTGNAISNHVEHPREVRAAQPATSTSAPSVEPSGTARTLAFTPGFHQPRYTLRGDAQDFIPRHLTAIATAIATVPRQSDGVNSVIEPELLSTGPHEAAEASESPSRAAVAQAPVRTEFIAQGGLQAGAHPGGQPDWIRLLRQQPPRRSRFACFFKDMELCKDAERRGCHATEDCAHCDWKRESRAKELRKEQAKAIEHLLGIAVD